jgi:hypothetical protein
MFGRETFELWQQMEARLSKAEKEEIDRMKVRVQFLFGISRLNDGHENLISVAEKLVGRLEGRQSSRVRQHWGKFGLIRNTPLAFTRANTIPINHNVDVPEEPDRSVLLLHV